MLDPLRAFHAILPIEQVCSPTTWISNGRRIRELLDQTRAFLAIVAVAGGAENGSAARFEFDATAQAPNSRALGHRFRHRLLPSSRCPTTNGLRAAYTRPCGLSQTNAGSLRAPSAREPRDPSAGPLRHCARAGQEFV